MRSRHSKQPAHPGGFLEHDFIARLSHLGTYARHSPESLLLLLNIEAYASHPGRRVQANIPRTLPRLPTERKSRSHITTHEIRVALPPEMPELQACMSSVHVFISFVSILICEEERIQTSCDVGTKRKIVSTRTK